MRILDAVSTVGSERFSAMRGCSAAVAFGRVTVIAARSNAIPEIDRVAMGLSLGELLLLPSAFNARVCFESTSPFGILDCGMLRELLSGADPEARQSRTVKSGNLARAKSTS